MARIQFNTGDLLIMKKTHPCGASAFMVTRCGADVKLLCTGCSRELMLPREKVEKMIKSVQTAENADTKEN